MDFRPCNTDGANEEENVGICKKISTIPQELDN